MISQTQQQAERKSFQPGLPESQNQRVPALLLRLATSHCTNTYLRGQ